MNDDTGGIEVVLVGSDPLALGGLAAALAGRRDVVVTGRSQPAADAVAFAVQEYGAHALLFDLLPGLRLEPEIAAAAPVVALVADADAAAEAMAGGAAGVVARSGEPDRMAAALVAVTRRLRVVDEAFAADLFPPEASHEVGSDPLTPRELEVLELVAEGLSNRAIGRRLGTSDHTAKFHVNTILYKLGARTRTDAVVRAVRRGVLRI